MIVDFSRDGDEKFNKKYKSSPDSSLSFYQYREELVIMRIIIRRDGGGEEMEDNTKH